VEFINRALLDHSNKAYTFQQVKADSDVDSSDIKGVGVA